LSEKNATEEAPEPIKGKDLLVKKEERKVVAAGPFIPKAPERFSYSQFAAYEKCPYQYRFANILKVPVRGKPSFSFGKTLHATLQKILERVAAASGFGQNSLFESGDKKIEPITLEECLKIYEECWDDDWYPSEGLKKEYKDNGQRIVKEFYQENKDNWPKVVFLEKAFSLRLKVDGDGVTIAGKIDRIDETPDGKLRIVDYKTGSPKEKLEFDDKAQLLIYQQAAKELFRQEVGALAFRYLEDGSEIEFLGKDKDFEKLDEKMCDIIRHIRKGEFPAKPGMCKYCDFNGICEYKKL
jgi:putative RecB family exonuclease